MSKRGENWSGFADRVRDHIDNYTVAQYGDEGEDLATHYTAEDCIKQAKKYLERFGKNARPGQERRDMMKAVHYIQMADERMQDAAGQATV